MRISKREFDALAGFIRKKSNDEISSEMRYAISGIDPRKSSRDLQALGAERLTKLIQLLPGGKTAPTLAKLRRKARQSLAGLRVPHLDPETWPQIYRMQVRLNSDRYGLKNLGVGQIGTLHPKGKSLHKPLRISSTWESSDAGDLVIMGPWRDIVSLLATSSGSFTSKFGERYDRDVNAAYDRKFGQPKGEGPNWFENVGALPLFVTLSDGAQFTKTDVEGHVVVNAPDEIVELVGGKISGADSDGADISASEIITEIQQTMEQPVRNTIQSADKNHTLVREEKLNKTLCTLTIGIGPAGRNYAVGTDTMTATDILRVARTLR